MDILYVYTTYTLLFVAVLTACVILAALMGTYIAVRVRKDMLFFAYLLIQTVFLLQLCADLFAFVSPIQPVADHWRALQRTTVFILVPALLLFSAVLLRKQNDKKLVLPAFVFVLTIYACFAAMLVTSSKWLFDSAAPCAQLLWIAFIFFWRKEIFSAFSGLSIDMYMDQIDDAVLIFDSMHKLMDQNRNAHALFPYMTESSTIDDLFAVLGTRSASALPPPLVLYQINPEPFEFGLRDESGTRYLRCVASEVKFRDQARMATVLTFYDVTEKTELLHTLEEKNQALRKLNDALRNDIDVTNRLENEEEKIRASADIHEKISLSISELLTGLEALEADIAAQDGTTAVKLDQIIESCRVVMAEIRRSLEKLMS